MKTNTSFFKNAFKLILSSLALGELITILFFLLAKADFAFNMIAEPGITFSRFMTILLFSFIINVSGLIFKAPRLNYALKVIIHSIIICVSFVFALKFMNGGASLDSAAIFVLAFMLFVVYFLAFALYALAKKLIKKKSPSEKTAYTKQF